MVRFLAVLTLALSAHAATPHAGPELPLSPARSIPTLGEQSSPAIASRGEDAFAVWTDTRDASYGALLGSRVADDGTFLDPHGILIDAEAGAEPEIVWTGSEYLVISGSRWWPPYGYYFAYTHRVRPDGSLAAERVALGALVDWRLYSSGRETVMTAMKPDGRFLAFLDAAGQIRETVPSVRIHSASTMVPDGEDWILFSSDNYCDPSCNGPWIKQTRVRDGKVVSDRKLELTLNSLAWPLTAASNGNGQFVLVWDDIWHTVKPKTQSYDGSVWYMVVDRDGKIIRPPHAVDRVKAEIPSDIPHVGLDRPDVTWFGGRFVATWAWFDVSGRSEVRTINIDPDGGTDTKDPVIVHGQTLPLAEFGTRRPVIAATSSRLQFLFPTSFLDGSWRNTLAARAVSSLAELALPFEPVSLTKSATRQIGIEAAAGDDAIFINWIEYSDETQSTLRGRIVWNDGRESPVLTISEGEDASTPAVAYGGGVWLVAWSERLYRESANTRETSGLKRMARRFDRQGNSLDSVPMLLNTEAYSQGAYSPYHFQKISVSSSGSEFFMAWPGIAGNNFRQLRSARIGIDGALIDAKPRYIAPAGNSFHGEPLTLWNGNDYFLLWREIPVATGNPIPALPSYARSTRMNRNGEVSGAFSQLVTTGKGYDIERSTFEAATNGETVLVTWAERFHASKGCVYAQEFTFDGAPAGAKQEVTCGDSYPSVPQRAFAVWDGTRFQVIYSFDNAMWAWAADTSGPSVELFRATGSLRATRPVATPVGIVLTYTRSATEFGSLPRAFRRTVSFEPPRRRAISTR